MRLQRQRAFTLIELLIAIAIFALIAMAAYGSLDSVIDAATAVDEQSKRLDSLQWTLTQMQSDIEQLTDRPVRDELGDERPALVYTPLPPSLEFTRNGWPNPAEQTRSNLQRLAYRFDEDNGRLYREYWFDLDRLQGATVKRRLLLEQVEKFVFRFMDQQRQWQDHWPPLDQGDDAVGSLPLAIEVIFELKGWGEFRRIYVLPG